ncbi:MAG TPA: M1 family metallopeptidase [Gemmatimonadaceae bacterium]|nr:M1 family metallopeptidase [Gemmatimonadaceae bacterium]
MHTSVRRALTIVAATAAASALPLAGAHAQQTDSSRPQVDRYGVADTSIFAPLTLRAATEYRDASGSPGHAYWQNRADYHITATLDTAAKSLSGQLTLHYTNNSPDTLRFLWIQVEQNAFHPGSLNDYIFSQNSRFGARGFEGGDVIDHFQQVTAAHGKNTARSAELHRRVEGTEMKVDLAEPIAPGASTSFDVAWHFLIPEHGADRMGRDGPLFELAQWYPRVNVYDDVRGWNTEPYLGQGEFYLEYGDFDYEVTVPAGYIVAGTGMLQNPRDVLTATQIERLARAAKSDSAIAIVTAAELQSGAARPRKTGTMTWKFAAKNVRDVAWAASPDYQWDASSWKGILAQAYYRPSAAVNWDDGADQARMSIEEYSTRWFQYPYPQISAVEGPISGMEYPMLAMENRSQDKPDLYNVVTHEIGHNWFPMIVGSNERMHMWQDEGFNTFINTFSEARRYPQNGDQMQRALNERQQVEQAMRLGFDVPIDVQPDRVNAQLLGYSQYTKTSVGLQLLRQEVLGPEAFDDAFRTYIRRWAFKHPTPADFYRTMEDVGGRRLDWFWREWFITNAKFDQAIDTVATATRGDTSLVAVAYGNHARGVLPVRARLTFSDGTTQDLVYPAEVWSTNSSRYIRRYSFVGKHVTKIELDPDKRLVDIDRSNNVWTAPGLASGSGGGGGGGR